LSEEVLLGRAQDVARVVRRFSAKGCLLLAKRVDGETNGNGDQRQQSQEG
jgi:hypothetical protein